MSDERVDAEELEPADRVGRVGRAVERHARALPVAEAVEVGEVREALVDREGLLVGGGEGAPEAVHEAVAGLLAVGGAQRVAEAVGPRAAHLDEPLLEASSSARSRVRTRLPRGTRTTNCSRDRALSLTRAENSTDSPPNVALRMSAIRSRTPVL